MTLMIWINLVMQMLETRQLKIYKIKETEKRRKVCATNWWRKVRFALAEGGAKRGFEPAAPRSVGLRGLGVKHPLELTFPDQKGYIDIS
ncbi:hypothetical protein L6452_37696 [Arctium lappa]|uniref:Uncharacterized protein n=1 Tax=Arctium lappa TaxID=4217 RepID=A0ACB8Y4S1_ARCLA|nr:hypothetical protein L6452_37696 [Arctium lappa]